MSKNDFFEFHNIIYDLDDISDGIYLIIDDKGNLFDIAFEESENKKYRSYFLYDFNEEFSFAIDEENKEQIDFFNKIIKQSYKILKQKKDEFIPKVEDNFKCSLKYIKDAKEQTELMQYHTSLIEKYKSTL